MRIFYLKIDGTMKIEKTKATEPILEMRDGYHPITNDSIWQDTKQRGDARLFIVQRVTPPLGANMAHNDIKAILQEQIISEHGFKKPQVSKMWMRGVERAVDWLLANGIILAITALIIYVVAQYILGADFQ